MAERHFPDLVSDPERRRSAARCTRASRRWAFPRCCTRISRSTRTMPVWACRQRLDDRQPALRGRRIPARRLFGDPPALLPRPGAGYYGRCRAPDPRTNGTMTPRRTEISPGIDHGTRYPARAIWPPFTRNCAARVKSIRGRAHCSPRS